MENSFGAISYSIINRKGSLNESVMYHSLDKIENKKEYDLINGVLTYKILLCALNYLRRIVYSIFIKINNTHQQ